MSILKRILVLGTGMVTGPLYEDLSNEDGVQVTAVGKRWPGLRRAGQTCPGAKLECMDVTEDIDRRDSLIAQHDLVVSCLPLHLVEDIFLACLAQKRNLLTLNYDLPEFKKLHKQAVDADLIFLVAMGFRPGLDHMAAKTTIDDIQERGGEVTSYEMYTAGIPPPESANNPLKYKFSWNPSRAMWKNWKESGYMKDGKTTILPTGTGTMEAVHKIGAVRDFKEEFEGCYYAFDRSLLSLYGIETAHTLVCGSMRYKGFCAVILSLMKLGLYNVSTHQLLADDAQPFTWRNYMCCELGLTDNVTDEVLESKVKDRTGGSGQIEVIRRFGLLGSEEVEKKETIFDTLVCFIRKRPEFFYGPNEQDMTLMDVKVTAAFQDGSSETRKLELTVFGDAGGHTAMAKCVGRCAATAAMMIVNGEITERGVILPILPEIYKPILERLERKGIKIVARK